ncbi:disks large homolog 5-like [Apodemus sylvaticus]|uniref:disks large homolog 5-like n=1 Tax=Apodemus sylvaticus TaxID=10129 RepID=UPI0022444DBE|nr:disks large homolog 5-like [Apodemus sylvaticus]
MFARLRNLFGRAREDGRETRERRKETALSSESNEGRRRWSWGMQRAGRQTSSSETVLSKKKAKKEEEKLTTELQLVTQERNEVNDHLISITEGAMNKRTQPEMMLNPMYEQLKLKEKEIKRRSFLHNLEMEKIEAQENIQDLKKEINFYSNLHSRLLMEKMLVKKRRVMLMRESKEVLLDWSLIEKYLVGLNMNDKDKHEKTSNLQTQHQVPEMVARAEISTDQEEGHMQNDFPPQEPPAEHHPQQPHNFLDESSST